MDLMTAEEAYKISMENIPEQVKNVVDKMRFEILHSCDLGYTSAEMHIDPRLGNNPAFLTAVYKAFEEKNYNVYLVEGEEDGRYKLRFYGNHMSIWKKTKPLKMQKPFDSCLI